MGELFREKYTKHFGNYTTFRFLKTTMLRVIAIDNCFSIFTFDIKPGVQYVLSAMEPHSGKIARLPDCSVN